MTPEESTAFNQNADALRVAIDDHTDALKHYATEVKANTAAINSLTTVWGALNRRAKEIEAHEKGGTLTAAGVPVAHIPPANFVL